MDILAVLISVSGLMLVLGAAYVVLRGTLLDVMHLRENPWIFLWYLSIALVLIPLIIVSITGIDNVAILFLARSGLEQPVAAVTVITLLIYILSLGFFLRVFGLRNRRLTLAPIPDESKISRLLFSVSILGLLLIGVFYMLGYRHAFFHSFIENKSVLQIRLENKYNSHVPSQIASLLPFAGYVVAILSGYMGRYKIKKSLLYLFVAVIFLSTPGDKAPPIKGIILWIFGSGKLLPKRWLSAKFLLFAVFVGLIAFAGIYFTLSRQVSDLSIKLLINYLLNRLGVGQMAGMYETFALIAYFGLPEGDYFWHIVPGAKFFVNYIDYQKLLMMISEGVDYTEMGVKNTYFVAEAYAIGGPFLAFLAPVIVGFSYALGIYLTIRFTGRLFGQSMAFRLGFPVYLLTHDITGGFSPFPLLKGVLLIFLQLLVLSMFHRLVDLFYGMVLRMALGSLEKTRFKETSHLA